MKRGELARRQASRSSRTIELSKERLEAGLLLEKFPQVSQITILATYYYDRTGPVLMVQTVNIFPNSSACFHFQCPKKDCTHGFDLSPDIVELVGKGGKSARGSAACGGDNGAGSPVHASISYEITVQYNSLNRHKKTGQKA
ncbi:MAG: hypothetical protein M0Z58_09045 [Nitrospiraceae bacterium]|nr:hypothetical protein [Nitrospiraceae bacterium]